MRRMGNKLSWIESTRGPQHAALWAVTALSAFHVLFWFCYGLTPCWQLMGLNVVVVAKKEAARQALDALMDPA